MAGSCRCVCDDEHPGQVGPKHVLLLPRHVNAEPAGHAGDVDQAGNAVEHVVPAAIQRHAFGGNPRGTPGANGGFEVGDHGDENVDGHDHEREAFEPLGLADLAPLVFERHEANAARGGSIQFGIVEPAGHMNVGRVVERPLGAHSGGRVNGDEVDGQNGRHDQERDHATGFGAAGQLIGTDEAAEYEDPADPLVYGGVAIDLEQHRFSFLSTHMRARVDSAFTCIRSDAASALRPV